MYKNLDATELVNLIVQEWNIRNSYPKNSWEWNDHDHNCYEIGNELRDRYGWKNEDFTHLYYSSVRE